MNIQELIKSSIVFLNKTLVPILFALAFLFFLINVVRYFIIGGGSEDAHKKAKTLALWGIIAFVLMVSIWGVVNVFISGIGISRNITPCPDFICRGGGSGPETGFDIYTPIQ
jgi:hypothetical protein